MLVNNAFNIFSVLNTKKFQTLTLAPNRLLLLMVDYVWYPSAWANDMGALFKLFLKSNFRFSLVPSLMLTIQNQGK